MAAARPMVPSARRWVIPVGGRYRSSRDVIQAVVAPALRAGGWLYGPGTTHFVEDQGTETWLTGPSVAVVDLAAFLTEVSETYRRSCPSYDATTHRWRRRRRQAAKQGGRRDSAA